QAGPGISQSHLLGNVREPPSAVVAQQEVTHLAVFGHGTEQEQIRTVVAVEIENDHGGPKPIANLTSQLPVRGRQDVCPGGPACAPGERDLKAGVAEEQRQRSDVSKRSRFFLSGASPDDLRVTAELAVTGTGGGWRVPVRGLQVFKPLQKG